MTNLYRISQSENTDYDTYDSAIVAAESEDQAKNISPSEYNNKVIIDWEGDLDDWASSPDNVTVELIGVAKEGTPVGLILASFNAG